MVGACLVAALSWAVPQPPASQASPKMLMLEKHPIVEQKQPRKGGGVRGQSKLPPKKMSKTVPEQQEQNWDPDALERQVEEHEEHEDDDEEHEDDDDSIRKKSDETAKRRETDGSSNEEGAEAIDSPAELPREQSGASPFGREKNNVVDANKENDIQDSDASGQDDPNDPDETDEQPVPSTSKRVHLEVNAIGGNKLGNTKEEANPVATEAKHSITTDEASIEKKAAGESATERRDMDSLTNRTDAPVDSAETRPQDDEKVTEEAIVGGDKDGSPEENDEKQTGSSAENKAKVSGGKSTNESDTVDEANSTKKQSLRGKQKTIKLSKPDVTSKAQSNGVKKEVDTRSSTEHGNDTSANVA